MVRGEAPYVVEGWTRIVAETPDSFTLHVMLPMGDISVRGIPLNPTDDRLSSDTPEDLGWFVTWIGIEGI